MDINNILVDAVRRGASDIHLMAESVPIARIRGSLVALEGYASLTSDDMKKAIRL